MADNSSRAAEIIATLKAEKLALSKMLAHVVLAAGGKVKVSAEQLADLSLVKVTVWVDPADDSRTLEASR